MKSDGEISNKKVTKAKTKKKKRKEAAQGSSTPPEASRVQDLKNGLDVKAVVEKKKKKKKKEKQIGETGNDVEDKTTKKTSENAETKLELKKRKKSAQEADGQKTKKRKSSAATQNAQASRDQSELHTAEENKKMKKSKKKKKKEEREEKSKSSSDKPELEPKKTAGAQPAAASRPEARKMAEVGDKEIPRSSPPIRRVAYQVHKAIQNRPESQVVAFLTENRISVEGCAIRPVQNFEEAGFSSDILAVTKGFQKPSPIQAQSWPIILSGRDMVGTAATGSGKTLAFGLPGLVHVLTQKRAQLVEEGLPVMLTIAPTRELSQQIHEVLESAGRKCGLSCVCLFGGMSRRDQIAQLESGADIVVGTPGRLEDLINDNHLLLHHISYFVLDEADRMLDLGFLPSMRAIARRIRADRQTLMFSATWPQSVQALAHEFLSEPVRVVIGSAELAAAHSVTQTVEVCEPFDRDRKLLGLMRKYHTGKNRIIIFVLYKKEAPRVETNLKRTGLAVAAVHGDLSQHDRNTAVANFKSGATPVLIATDVAARGLDIPDVEVVINYSFPLTIEDYVHRIGRTGRAGKEGVAHTFFCGVNDKIRAGELVNVLKEANQAIPPDLLKFGTAIKKKESKLYGAHFKDIDPTAKGKRIVFD